MYIHQEILKSVLPLLNTEEDTLYETYKAACIKHDSLSKIINKTLLLGSMTELFEERDVAYAEMRLAEKRLYLRIVADA